MDRATSWVIVRLDNGIAVFETFSAAIASAVNTEKFVAVPILSYLQDLNARIKAGEE